MASKKSMPGNPPENPHPKSKAACPNCAPDMQDNQAPISQHMTKAMPKSKKAKKGMGY